MSAHQTKNKTRRQNQQSNVQKRLNERFKKFDKKRGRKQGSQTQIHPSTQAQASDNNNETTKSEGSVHSKSKRKKQSLQRSKTMNSDRRRHKFKTDTADSERNRSRSNSIDIINDSDAVQQTRKHSSSLSSHSRNRKYFTKGNNTYMTKSSANMRDLDSDEEAIIPIPIRNRHTITSLWRDKTEAETQSNPMLSRPLSVPQPHTQTSEPTQTQIALPEIIEEKEEEGKRFRIFKTITKSSNDSHAYVNTSIKCLVSAAHKYSDNGIEYEIEVSNVPLNQEWVIYKRFKDFYDFNTLLKREYKNVTRIPALPTRARLLNSVSYNTILERKSHLNNYLQSLLSNEALSNSPLLSQFLAMNDIGMRRYACDLWRKGDSQLSFDCHYILELRFSARNIGNNDGCLLRISQKTRNKYYYRQECIMRTDFVIDSKHPKFNHTLLYSYYKSRDNSIKIELCGDDSVLGSATVDVCALLATHKGYLYVPIAINNENRLIKRRSMPQLMGQLRVDENPAFTRIPCFIIAATAKQTHTTNKYQILPKLSLPIALRIMVWTEDLSNKLKAMTTHSIDSNQFRQSIKSNKKMLTEYHYFVCSDESESESKSSSSCVNDEIASLLLQVWKRCIDSYLNKKKVWSKSFQNTLLFVMCKLANRFEFDLSHIQHWQWESGFKAYTTFQWERIMKQYYKLFIRTLEIALEIMNEDTQKSDERERDTFCKEIIGLSSIRMSAMHTKLLPLLVNEINTIIRSSKSQRYECVLFKHTWQEQYVSDIANEAHKIISNDPFYNNCANYNCSKAWRWFAPSDKNAQTGNAPFTNAQKHYIRKRSHWQDIIRFIIGALGRYNRNGEMYWNKVEGYPRLEQLLVQSIIWTQPCADNGTLILSFVSSLMASTAEMRHSIGTYGKALLHATDAMRPSQVETCFAYLREWISLSRCDESGLLPHSFCYDSFYSACHSILAQEEWQIICVLLSFLLHHSRLLKESFRSLLFKELLIKQYFLKLACHWNRLVRKYYFMILLYCLNRSGFFTQERRKKCIVNVKIEQSIISCAHRCYVLFDNMAHFLTTFSPASPDLETVIDISTNIVKKVKLSEISTQSQDERNEMRHLHSVICDMTIVEKIENDASLIEILNLQITQIKTKRKDIPQSYRPYIDAAFKQFADLCLRYKKIQLTKKNGWVLGEVLTPGIIYHVRDRDKHLKKFQKSDHKSHKWLV